MLSIVSAGLIAAYAVLVYHIRKYFKGQMVLEMTRLTILFAVFCVSYGLRTVYQYYLGNWRNVVNSQLIRWHLVNTLPLVWDILSIGSILIMHHLTFNADKKVSREVGWTDGHESPQVHAVSRLGSVATFDEIFNDGEMTAQRILMMQDNYRSIIISENSIPPELYAHTKTE